MVVDEFDGWEFYWVEVWDSVNVIVVYLIEVKMFFFCVIDFGCGLGVVGCVVVFLGVSVLFLDNVFLSFLFVVWNVWFWKE